MIPASIADTGQLLTGIGTLLLAITAGGSAVAAVLSYQRQGDERRESGRREQQEAEERSGRWLTDLQQRFFSDSSFRSVRAHFYVGNDSPLAKAYEKKRSIETGEAQPGVALTDAEAELIVELDNYLDFFGLIWHLVDGKQLDEDEAYWLFSWYVTAGLKGIAVIFDDVTGEQTEFPDTRKLHQRFDAIDVSRGSTEQEKAVQAPSGRPAS